MNPLSLIPAPYRMIAGAIAIALVALAIYAAGRSHGAAGVQAKWDAEKVVQFEAAQVAEREARKTESEWKTKVIEAQNEAKKRESKLRSEIDSARRSSAGLLDDIAALRRSLSGDSLEACRRTADTALAVFGECADQYQRVAEAADEHASDAVMLQDAWPK